MIHHTMPVRSLHQDQYNFSQKARDSDRDSVLKQSMVAAEVDIEKGVRY
jgi:hypothetical protein